MAAEDWGRLKTFLTTGKVPEVGPLRKQYLELHTELGFSIRTLHEALTRGWDMHICNPLLVLEHERQSGNFVDERFWHRFDALLQGGRLGSGGRYNSLSYELGMEGAGGRYAAPFRLLLEQSSGVQAGIAFPIAAHFALQTSQPLEAYALVAPLLAREAKISRGEQIEELWLNFYDYARQRVAPVLDGAGIEHLTGEDVMRTSLVDHPLYRRGLDRLEILRQQSWRVPVTLRYLHVPETIRQRQVVDIVLSTPGISTHRSLLAACLPPPLVQFEDGESWTIGETTGSEFSQTARYADAELQHDAGIAKAIEASWKSMLNARWG